MRLLILLAAALLLAGCHKTIKEANAPQPLPTEHHTSAPTLSI